jgi:hypothetical protein
LWLRRLATFEAPQRLLGMTAGGSGGSPASGAATGPVPAAEPEAVAAWRGGA